MRNFDNSKGGKRGPKARNYEPALQAMVPLVRRGISVLAAARTVIDQGTCRVGQSEEATTHRLRTLFALNRERLMRREEGRTPPYTIAEQAWDEALSRAIFRSPQLGSQLLRRSAAIAPALWARIGAEARQIEREIRLERELREIHKWQRITNAVQQLRPAMYPNEEWSY